MQSQGLRSDAEVCPSGPGAVASRAALARPGTSEAARSSQLAVCRGRARGAGDGGCVHASLVPVTRARAAKGRSLVAFVPLEEPWPRRAVWPSRALQREGTLCDARVAGTGEYVYHAALEACIGVMVAMRGRGAPG